MKTIQEKYPDFIIDDVTKDILECLFTTTDNMFITGPAGCGKSTLLKVIKDPEIFNKNVVILCPTGVSAVNVEGVTFHNFFKFPPCLLSDDDCMKSLLSFGEESDEEDCMRMQILRAVDVFIIDEISMVNPNMFDSVDLFLRHHLDSDIPFAGKRLILFGDLYQLPPVVKKGSNEYTVLSERYGQNGFYFFNSDVYQKSIFKKFVMEKIHRQTDTTFINILHRIRKGLQTIDDIKEINNFVCDEGDYMDKYNHYLYVCYTNAIADNINQMYLDLIQSDSKTYYAESFGKVKAKDFTAPEELILKVGAQVMVCANTEGVYNGMIGEVTRLEDDKIYIVDKSGMHYSISKYTWKSYDYTLNSKKIEHTVVGKYIQFPLKLAFALNAHKCQGLTLDNIYLDIGTGSFTTGQFYVALSRLRTFEGLGLKKPINMLEIKVDKVVTEFFENLEK